MSEQVHLLAIFKAKPGRVKDLLAELRALSVPSRAEEGCIEYVFIQSNDDPDVVIAREIWRDTEADKFHWATPHFADAFTRIPEMIEGEPTVYRGTLVI